MQGCGVRRAQFKGRESESPLASSETGAETGEEVTGSQCSGDNGLRRGEEAGMDG